MKFSRLFLLPIIILLAVFASGCRKPQPPKAVVAVIMINNDGIEVPVPDVTVVMYSTPNGSYIDPEDEVIEDSKVTNPAGRVEFVVENDCILTAKAEYEIEKDVFISGKTLLIFKQDDTYEATIELE